MSDRLQRRSIAGRTFGIPICLLYHLKSTVITDPSGVACTARLLTAPASQEQAVPAMRLPSPHQIQRHSATTRSLEFYGQLLRSLTSERRALAARLLSVCRPAYLSISASLESVARCDQFTVYVQVITSCFAVRSPVPPVKPTYAVFAPTAAGIFTVQLCVKVFAALVVSVIVIVKVVPS